MKTLFTTLDTMSEFVVQTQRELVAIPAIGPANDGTGEAAKARHIKQLLHSLGIEDIREFNAPATDVPDGYRPNIIATITGQDASRTLWIIAHMDVVPPGDHALWNSDPYVLQQEGDRIIGRGVEDNHQGLVSALCLAKSLKETKTIPPINLGLAFIADEETGNEFGLEHLLNTHEELFKPQDLYIVPDSGEPDSRFIEIAEKSTAWFRLTVKGEQCHASTPEQGKNSLIASSDLVLRLQQLHQTFADTNELFSPPTSTFVPTKKEANVENINTLPGRDVFYLDARVLPHYDLGEVQREILRLGKAIEEKYKVTVECEAVMAEQAAPATSADSEIVTRISNAIEAVYNQKAYAAGIGGSTVAGGLRHKGLATVVWSTLNHQAHQPNEWSSISATINDAKVMAYVLMGGE